MHLAKVGNYKNLRVYRKIMENYLMDLSISPIAFNVPTCLNLYFRIGKCLTIETLKGTPAYKQDKIKML